MKLINGMLVKAATTKTCLCGTCREKKSPTAMNTRSLCNKCAKQRNK